MSAQIADRYHQTLKSGQWRMKPDKSIIWQEEVKVLEWDSVLTCWALKSVNVNELTPEESPFRCIKELDFDMLITRERDDDDSVSGKSMFYYVRKMHLKIKPDYENVWLTIGKDMRVYVKNLLTMVTYRNDLVSDEYVTARKISEKRITKEMALKLQTGYAYAKVEDDGQGNELFGRFVAPKNGA